MAATAARNTSRRATTLGRSRCAGRISFFSDQPLPLERAADGETADHTSGFLLEAMGNPLVRHRRALGEAGVEERAVVVDEEVGVPAAMRHGLDGAGLAVELAEAVDGGGRDGAAGVEDATTEIVGERGWHGVKLPLAI